MRQKRKRFDRRWNLKKRYGITEEYYDKLYQQQMGKCRICLSGNKKLVVDHSHEKMAVRSLLCDKCNISLGLLNEDPMTVRRMFKYIKEWRKYNAK